ncbi:MAG: nitroreductase family deazaflavin-dependent oxidoreductase [Anaerolineae bacterium]|nr:nitroreductase family deazaflavin-dependent oxidoreductase [Anaerolineae bacterium]
MMSHESKGLIRIDPAGAGQALRSLIPPEAAQLPILLWRLGLGKLIGQVLMLISTTGRRSGLVRRAAPEYFYVNGKKYVLADPEAQWYQNVQANPAATVQTAYGTETVIVRRVTDREELTAVFVTLLHNRPTTANSISRDLGVQSVEDDLAANTERLPLVTFDHTDLPTPPPLEADLRWALPVSIGVLYALWQLRKALRR